VGPGIPHSVAVLFYTAYVQRTLRSLRQHLTKEGGIWELYSVRIVISPLIILASIAVGY
jgi:mannitol-specific phosphotransferase system IIBC component